MTSRIDNPSMPVPQTPVTRRAEETDTRQAIQRHDPDFQRKKKNDDEETTFRDPYEDLTDVSVPGLRSFLAGLLDRIDAGAAKQAQTDTLTATTPAEQPRPPANPRAAAAMQAYQTGAVRGTAMQAPSHPSYMRDPAPPAPAAVPPANPDQPPTGCQ